MFEWIKSSSPIGPKVPEPKGHMELCKNAIIVASEAIKYVRELKKAYAETVLFSEDGSFMEALNGLPPDHVQALLELRRQILDIQDVRPYPPSFEDFYNVAIVGGSDIIHNGDHLIIKDIESLGSWLITNTDMMTAYDRYGRVIETRQLVSSMIPYFVAISQAPKRGSLNPKVSIPDYVERVYIGRQYVSGGAAVGDIEAGLMDHRIGEDGEIHDNKYEY